MWSNVELLANDDTGSGPLSIGSRQECGSALYQMNTLVKITTSRKVSSNPELNAYSLNDGCVLVGDRTVVVLDNVCQSLQMIIHFEAMVDIVGLCQKGQFLVAGERNGNLHLIQVSSKQTLLTKALVQSSFDEKSFLDLILKMDSSVEGTYHAFILTSKGFFCILHLPLADIQRAIIKMDINAAKKLQGQVETCFVSVEDYHHAATCFTSARKDASNSFALIIGGVGSGAISVWEVNPDKKQVSIQNVADSSLIQAAKKLQVVENSLFVLDNEDVLSSWDPHSLTLTWDCPSVRIEEFLLTSESDVSAGGGLGIANLKLVALTTPDHAEQRKSIVVFSLPAMHQLYALEVAPVSMLVKSAINTDIIYFMEGMYENNHKSSSDPVSFLLMRSLTEALPENRLSRLLHKRKFTEAESFALQFGLEIEFVHKAKANTILDGLACPESTDRPAWLTLVSQAKETLNKIKDNSFVVEYCVNAPWPTYETAQDMLHYARKRILKREDAAAACFANVDVTSLLTAVLRTQAKLATFHGAFGPEKYSGRTWLEFLNHKEVFNYVLFQLKGGDHSSAQYLWLRHQGELEGSFSLEMLDSLLESISGAFPLRGLGLWLKEVVLPFVRRVLPHGQKKVAKWLEERARSLELTDKTNWPENGLELARVFFTSKEVGDIGLTSFSHGDLLKTGEEKEIRNLMDLVDTLQNLVDLYRKYNCRLALCDFEKETADTIVFRMLDKILAAELLPPALENYIVPYMRRHRLDKDDVLLRYIKDLLRCHCTQWTSVFDTTWEAKAIAILGCMSDVELTFEGVLAVMRSAVVPWGPGVEGLVQRYLGMEHAKVKLLEEGYQLMEMKKLLWSYGIRDSNLLNDREMILVMAQYILKQDRPSALGDALKITRAYMLPTAEVYLCKIVNLFGKEKGEEILDLLRSLPPAEAAEIAERAVIWGRISLEEDLDTAEEKKMHLQVKKTLVEILKFLLSLQEENPMKKEEQEEDLETFKNLVTLQESFDICISPKDYWDPSRRAQLLEGHIQEYERDRRARHRQGGDAQLAGPGGRKALTQSRLYRLGFLLQKSEAEMGAELALRASGGGEVEEALRVCSYFYELHHNEEAGRLLFLVSQKLSHMLGSNIPMVLPEGLDLPDTIYRTACQAVTICSPDLCLDVLEFCNYTSLAREIYGKCQMEDLEDISPATSLDSDKDPFGDWTAEDFFAEDGAVLDPPAVLPSAYRIASSLVPAAGWRASPPLESASLAYCPFEQGKRCYSSCKNAIFALLSSLQEGSQYQLALSLVSSSFGSLAQHMACNTADLTLSKMLHGEQALEEARAFFLAMMKNFASAAQSIATALLHKVFNSPQVDHTLALGYCCLLPRAGVFGKLWEIVSQMSQSYKKILAVALVGTQLALLYENAQEKKVFEDLVTDAEWGLALGKLGVSFQGVFRMPAIRKKELIRTLVQHPDADTGLILRFCRAFQLDTDAALQVLVETQLQSASRAKGEPGAREEPHALAVARAVETLPLLSSTAGLVASLRTMLHKVDPYDYEAIESLLVVIDRAGGSQASGLPLNWATMLLKHLKSYKRVSPPGDLEQQFLFDQGLGLSPAAQTRLPFHLIFFKTSESFWKIISAEINQESFPKLLLICKVMKVCLDNLYASAVIHVFQDELKPKLLAAAASGGQAGPLDKRTEETMQTVQSYLLSISKPEWATAVAHQIAQELPTGPSKVQTLAICLDLAEKWLKNPTIKDDFREKAQIHLTKLQRQHKKAATEAVLAAQNLNLEDHQKLLGKPANLIILLYHHSSIAERIRNPTGRDYPDIHAAASEIAQINNLDLKKIWDTLLESWLCSYIVPTGETIEDSENVPEDEDFKRIIYLLQLYPVDSQSRILYECTVSAVSPIGVSRLTFAHKSRALRCLLFLVDPATVESLYKSPMRNVRNFLKCLIYLAELEALNIPYTYEAFHRAPKEGMIKGLWKNHSHQPKAVKLVAQLCLEYKVYDPVLWNGLLQKLMGFRMAHCLKKVLVETSGIYSLWPISSYSRAWQNVILDPILSASAPPNLDQLEACCGSFKMLLMCPVLADLDLIGISKRYAHLDLPGLALGCLALIPPSEKRDQQIQAFLSSCDLERALRQTEEHLSLGEAATPASQVRSFILDHILHEAGKDLADVKCFPLLRLQDRRPGQVKSLVEKLVAMNRVEDAASLITEYLQKADTSLPSKQTASEIVEVYLGEQAQILP